MSEPLTTDEAWSALRGASSKEVGRSLGISPRTAEFHRANIMQKIGAKNTIDPVRKVLGE